jgi:hypothetical protein
MILDLFPAENRVELTIALGAIYDQPSWASHSLVLSIRCLNGHGVRNVPQVPIR